MASDDIISTPCFGDYRARPRELWKLVNGSSYMLLPRISIILGLTHHWPTQVTWPCLTSKGLGFACPGCAHFFPRRTPSRLAAVRPITPDRQPGGRVGVLFCKLSTLPGALTQMEGHPKSARNGTSGKSADRPTLLLKKNGGGGGRALNRLF